MKIRRTHFKAIFSSIMMAAPWCFGEPPHVFWANDEVAPGETAQIIGAGFSGLRKVEVAAVSAAQTKQNWQEVTAIQPSDEALKFVVPESLEPGLFCYRIQTASGDVRGVLNLPDVWWVLGDQGASASPGGELRLYGKNFIPGPQDRWPLELVGEQTYKLFATGDRYHGVVKLPADLLPGSYKVRLVTDHLIADQNHQEVSLTVKKREPWPDKIFNVRELGAEGNGEKDDTDALEKALSACAENHGGVVFFPRGRYKLTRPINIPPYTILRGEGQELVNLLWPDVAAPPHEWIAGSHHFAIEDMTLYCTNYLKFITADKSDSALGNVRVERIRIRASMFMGRLTPDQLSDRTKALVKAGHKDGSWLLDLGGENNRVSECDFLAAGGCVALTHCRYSRINHNTLGIGRAGMGGTVVIGGIGLDLSENLYDGRDLATGNGAGGLGYGNLTNLYLAGNQFKMIQGWNREAVTSDAPGGYYLGKLLARSDTEFSLDHPAGPNLKDLIGSALFVIDGKGKGQWREVKAYQDGVVHLERPFDVAPDATSVATIVPQIRRWIVTANDFSDTGVAVQFYGSSLDCIASRNTMSRACGYVNYARNYHGLQPSWNIQWLNNKILEGNYYGSTLEQHVAYPAKFSIVSIPFGAGVDTALAYGCVLKGNVAQSNSGIVVANQITKAQAEHPLTTVQQVVLEKNEIHQSDIGIQVTKGTKGILVRKNQMDRVDRPYDIQGGDILLEK
jgi:Pectate lyase superfamily protein